MSEEKANNKWDFSDYAFAITGIFVGAFLILPELLHNLFGIYIPGGNLEGLAEALEKSSRTLNGFGFREFRALSPLLFLLTTTIVFSKMPSTQEKPADIPAACLHIPSGLCLKTRFMWQSPQLWYMPRFLPAQCMPRGWPGL